MNAMIRGKWFCATLVAVALTTLGCAAGGTGGAGGSGEGGSDWSGVGSGMSSSSGGGGGPMSGPKRIFITKTEYNGNLAEAGNAATGIEGGDNLCKLAAEAAVLGGTWKAWLSDANTDAIDRLDDVGPWYTVDRSEIIFNNKANIITGPLAAVGLNENGESLGLNREVWTGTKLNGRKDPEYVNDCEDWKNGTNTGDGWTGSGVHSDTWWTQYYERPCQSGNHLYCFEQ
jgi:hypothetical protein